MPPVPIHYLRSNETVWTPPCVIVLDTETKVIQQYPEVQAIRLWHARLADRRRQGAHGPGEVQADGDTAQQIAELIDGWSKGRQTIWLYCHNVSFDLAVTRLPVLMCRMGWEITDAAVDGRSPWLRLHKGRKTLTVCDSHSYLPVPLQVVGMAVGTDKPKLPEGDDREDWLNRCSADTRILMDAILTLMQWWDDNRLGRWSITGGATGWNCYRHVDTPWKMLIDPDPDLVAHDRTAIYGGRRYVWRVGELPPGRYSEIDFERAYTVVAAEMPLPCRRGYMFESVSLDSPLIWSNQWGMVAECVIETDIPRWPVRVNDRVWYPVGRFTTVLAGPDIRQAARLGCLRSIGHGQVHKLGYHMQNWARWNLEQQARPDSEVPPVVKITLKHWGRTCIGKWAQRKYARKRIGIATTAGWHYEDCVINATGARGSIIDIGGYKFLSYPDGEGDNAYPAVLAYVEAYVRSALACALDVIGDAAAVQCDTDGMIINAGTIERGPWPPGWEFIGDMPAEMRIGTVLQSASELTAPLRLREKTSYRTLEVIGPQHFKMDGRRRFSGVPSSAQVNTNGELEAWTWPRLGYQMSDGDPRGYVRVTQRYVVTGTYAPGWVISTGDVRPPEAFIGANGTELTPWESTRYAANGETLAEQQNAELVRVFDDGYATA